MFWQSVLGGFMSIFSWKFWAIAAIWTVSQYVFELLMHLVAGGVTFGAMSLGDRHPKLATTGIVLSWLIPGLGHGIITATIVLVFSPVFLDIYLVSATGISDTIMPGSFVFPNLMWAYVTALLVCWIVHSSIISPFALMLGPYGDQTIVALTVLSLWTKRIASAAYYMGQTSLASLMRTAVPSFWICLGFAVVSVLISFILFALLGSLVKRSEASLSVVGLAVSALPLLMPLFMLGRYVNLQLLAHP